MEAHVTVEAFPGRVDDGQVVAGASSDHQVERTPLQQLGGTRAPPSVRLTDCAESPLDFGVKT